MVDSKRTSTTTSSSNKSRSRRDDDDDDDHNNKGKLKKQKKKEEEEKCNDDDDDDNVVDDDNSDEMNEFMDRIWYHYCNYNGDNDDDEEGDDDDDNRQDMDGSGGGDIDELIEIITLIDTTIPNCKDEVYVVPTTTIVSSTTIQQQTKRQLVPLLISVCCTLIADHYIADYIHLLSSSSSSKQQQQDQQELNYNNNEQEKEELLHTIRQYLFRSLQSFPQNAAAIQIATNFIRMTMTKSTTTNNQNTTTTNSSNSHQSNSSSNTTTTTTSSTNLLLLYAKLYQYAADTAHTIRETILPLVLQEQDKLQQQEDDTPDTTTSTSMDWTITLLLHEVCGVDMMLNYNDDNSDDDDDDYNNDDDDDDIPVSSSMRQAATTIHWSSSKVEGSSRYMSVMMYSCYCYNNNNNNNSNNHGSSYNNNNDDDTTSTKGVTQYDTEIIHQLQQLHVTHRIHPNVWLCNSNNNKKMINNTTPIHLEPSKTDTIPPLSFRGISSSIPSITTTTTGGDSGGVLPQHLYYRLCTIFHPNANYWYESDYSNRGYFSFYTNIQTRDETTTNELQNEEKKKKNNGNIARNVIDDIVCNYLLPLAEQQSEYNVMSSTSSCKSNDIVDSNNDNNNNNNSKPKNVIVGYEWWVHTRDMASNLGHNLHFDTDEYALQRNSHDMNGNDDDDDEENENDDDTTKTASIHHPYISSVLYLTGGATSNDRDDSVIADNNTTTTHHHQQQQQHRGGATIIFDQHPYSKTNAERVWYSHPINNSFMIFPGNLLHGVLPCITTTASTTDTIRNDLPLPNEAVLSSLVDLLSEESNVIEQGKKSESSKNHRLTLMIGFWTRDVVSDILKHDPTITYEEQLYGACSPLPPIETTKWVQELCDGYIDHSSNNNDTTTATAPTTNIDHSSREHHIQQQQAIPLPFATPAWDVVPPQSQKNTNANDSKKEIEQQLRLDIPPDIDHKFFVRDAPHCFLQHLLEASNSLLAVNIDDDYDEE